MIDFLLDTDIASTSSRDNRRKLWPDYKPWISRKSESSTIALSELEYGVSKSSKPEQNKLALAEFAAPSARDKYQPQVDSYRQAVCSLLGLPEAAVEARLAFVATGDVLRL